MFLIVTDVSERSSLTFVWLHALGHLTCAYVWQSLAVTQDRGFTSTVATQTVEVKPPPVTSPGAALLGRSKAAWDKGMLPIACFETYFMRRAEQ